MKTEVPSKPKSISRVIRVAMLVTDANDRPGMTHGDASKKSPVLHPAVENLLQGLKDFKELQVTVVYAKANQAPEEFRTEGNLSYHPVSYKSFGIGKFGSSFLGRAAAISRHLRTNDYDLIHGQGTERECGLVAALSQQPGVVTLHGNLSEIAKSIHAKKFSYFWFAAILEKLVIKRASGIICISTHAERSVEGTANSTWVVPNPVSPRFFRIIRKPSSSPKVVCVSDIAEWKDPVLLVHASDRFRSEFPESEIHFHGACNSSHPYGAAFMNAISSRPWCIFHGKSPAADIEEAFSHATCVVLPSRQENFGLALAEAMAAGVPCVGSSAGGIPDVIDDGETGLLFPQGDQEALTDSLIRIHRDKKTAEKIAVAGRKKAGSRFSPAPVAKAHLEIYRSVVNS